jgi:tetratricopeptide (TPR) repeat protein
MIQVFVLFCLALQVQPAQPAFSPEERAALQSGVDAEKRGDLEQAIAAFRKAADLAPADAIAFLRLGDAYMKKRDYGDAVAPLKRAAELSPNSLPAHQLLGYALLAQGYASEAIPHFQMVHEYGALGIAQLQAGRYADAVTNLKAALDKTPNDPDLLYYLGRAGSSLASESQEKLLSAFPHTARWHQALGQNYYAIKMLREAEKEYEQALAMRPDLPGLRLELGQIYAASSQWDKAEEEFREEVKLQPGSAEAAYRLGQALLQQGKMEEAASELRRSDQLRPDMPETLYALGRATTVSDPRGAEHALGRVIELEKESYLAGQAYLLLAGVHRKQGKTEQAAHDMQEYRRIQALNARMVDKKSPS